MRISLKLRALVCPSVCLSVRVFQRKRQNGRVYGYIRYTNQTVNDGVAHSILLFLFIISVMTRPFGYDQEQF